ncbi:MAG TPA: tetratricopeptide repeat protein [Verrucomicrobiae bacterium]
MARFFSLRPWSCALPVRRADAQGEIGPENRREDRGDARSVLSLFAWRGCACVGLALLLAGCTPAGPRALLKGKKCLDRGDVAGAVAQLRRATALLGTNAGAWNYYGVALQYAGRGDDAAAAYQNALRLDRDLMEAHFNLGCLALEQNRPDVARAEFTAYTLRRPNEAVAWLKLGSAQLRVGDPLSAERSFSAVYHMDATNPDALNGLGLARVQRGRFGEAAQFFAAAVQGHPTFAPAWLNLAIVNQQFLHDNKAALEDFRRYLGITPRPANYDEVKAFAASLEQNEVVPPPVTPPAPPARTPSPPQPVETKPRTMSTPPPAPTPVAISRTEPEEKPAPRPTPRVAAAPVVSAPVTAIPAQSVRVQPATEIAPPPKATPAATAITVRPAAVTNAVAASEPLEAPMPENEPRHGFFHRVFGANRADNNTATAAKPASPATGTGPAAATGDQLAATKAEEDKPAGTKPAPVNFPRYAYTSPTRPAPGERRAAEGAFTKARLAEQDESWADALKWYQAAANTDPAWFEAEYNAGVMAHRLHVYGTALPRYELALAIQPDSVDARYNFALAMKSAGYATDSAEELKKVLATHPEEVRAHLALANLSAQSLHDVAQARQHYLKVLELQPDNPQANDIRFWLSGNSK